MDKEDLSSILGKFYKSYVSGFILKAMKAPELKEKLEESEKLIKELTVTWEEKLRKTEEIAQVAW